ncbi:MAG: S8 family serine peptidase [Caldilineaceae bacterium]|nr:S8 family serine peptidase [Caldilineaceae bacterium]
MKFHQADQQGHSGLKRNRALAGALVLPPLLLLVALFLLLHTQIPIHAGQAASHRLTGAYALSDDRGEGDKEEIEGLLTAAPPSGTVGVWVIQTDYQVTHTLMSDLDTRFDKGVPLVGSWVEAEYAAQGDGVWLLLRLRPDEYEDGEVVARLASGVLPNTIADRYQLITQQALLSSADIYRFLMADDDEEIDTVIAALQQDPDVVWAELNYVGGAPVGNPYKIWHWGGADDTGYINQAAIEQINLAAALTHTSGAGVQVAILDTGVDLDHPAFAGRLLAGWDMVADDPLPQDEGSGLGWGHGTHVAGIIARVAPESKLIPLRVLDANGLGNTFTLAYAIEWATEQGADVINLSLGAEADSQVLRTAVQYALDRGVTIVAAGGNRGTNQRQFPAAYPGVIGVTAVDEANRKADFANYGAAWVDLAAPGVGITSTFVGPDGSGYASWSGTSMATAFVSGAAALARPLLSAPSVTATQQLFWSHGVDLDALNPHYAGQLGRMLDAGAAVESIAQPATPTPDATITPHTPTPTASPHPSHTPSPAPSPTPTASPTTPGNAGGQSQLHLPVILR